MSDVLPIPLDSLVAGRYRIDAALARGGMGVVYRATDLRFGRPVALKATLPAAAADPDMRARFEREARLSNLLGDEDGFVRTSDWGVLDDGGLYLIMQLVEGARPLDVTTGTVDERVRRVVTAARLVARAHGHRVIHRDLKPANFLVARGGAVLLSDFGLAKRLGGPDEARDDATLRTMKNAAFGTPPFMPPEQFEDAGGVDERADVYALGVILFMALTGGRVPYAWTGSVAPLWRAQEQVRLGRVAAPRPGEHAPVPEALDALCARALALDRDARLGSATELADALEAALASDPAPPTLPPSPPPPTPSPSSTSGAYVARFEGPDGRYEQAVAVIDAICPRTVGWSEGLETALAALAAARGAHVALRLSLRGRLLRRMVLVTTAPEAVQSAEELLEPLMRLERVRSGSILRPSRQAAHDALLRDVARWCARSCVTTRTFLGCTITERAPLRPHADALLAVALRSVRADIALDYQINVRPHAFGIDDERELRKAQARRELELERHPVLVKSHAELVRRALSSNGLVEELLANDPLIADRVMRDALDFRESPALSEDMAMGLHASLSSSATEDVHARAAQAVDRRDALAVLHVERAMSALLPLLGNVVD